MGEGVLEFEAAAADVLEVGAEEADGGIGGDGSAGLVDALLIDEDPAGEDEGLGAFAGWGVAVIDEEFIETDFVEAGFFVVLFWRFRHGSVLRGSPSMPASAAFILFYLFTAGIMVGNRRLEADLESDREIDLETDLGR
jgi:hypothetical protein